MKVQTVFRADPVARLYRIARLIWDCGVVGDGKGYSNKLSVALMPRLFGWKREYGGWIATMLGLRVHYSRSYGGRFA